MPQNTALSESSIFMDFIFFPGYLKFGINTSEDGTVYREWAPAAQ